MFNGYRNEQIKEVNDRVEKEKRKYCNSSQTKKDRQDKLVHNYKKRVENFVMQMLEKPIKYHEFNAPETHKFREEDPSKFKGGATILIKSFKTERDRIRESIEKNNKEYMNDHALFGPYEYRKRDLQAEIQPQMHFSTKSGLDRIASKLGNMRSTVDNETKRFDRNDSFLLELGKSPVVATNKYIAKHFMPELHQKTHFKAASSLYLALPDSLVDQSTPSGQREKRLDKSLAPLSVDRAQTNLRQHQGDGDSSIEGRGRLRLPNLKEYNKPNTTREGGGGIDPEPEDNQKNVEKNYNIESVNPVEVSKQILLDCNFIRTKPLSVRSLKAGEGHMSMSPEKSNRDLYYELVPKKRPVFFS